MDKAFPSGAARLKYSYRVHERTYDVELARKADSWAASVDNQPYDVQVLSSAEGEIRLLVSGRAATVQWALEGRRRWIFVHGRTFMMEKPSSVAERRHGDGGAAENKLRAPMPGQVRAVQVEQGAQVERGQTILLLEAMKMELRIQAPYAGRVAQVLVQPGEAVDRDQVLAEIV